MLLEPPRPVVPARHRLTAPLVLRAGGGAAAAVLAISSRGDALVLAALLAATAWRPLPAVGIVGALVATAWRFSSSSLEDIAGAQAVLGPAGWVGPGSSASAAWLAAVALVCAAPWLPESLRAGVGRFPSGAAQGVLILAAGASASVVVAGPNAGGEVWVRPVSGVVAAGLAAAVCVMRRGGASWVLDGLAAAAGGAALVAVSREAGAWSGTVTAGSAVEAGLLAVATVAVVATLAVTLTVMEQHGR